MTRSELKDIINECIDERLLETSIVNQKQEHDEDQQNHHDHYGRHYVAPKPKDFGPNPEKKEIENDDFGIEKDDD